MDIMAEDSLCGYVFQPMVNLVTMLLIILGGLGYIVWWDVLRVLKNIRSQKLKCFRLLTLHSKIALTVTGILIVVGAAAFYIFEYDNPLTMQGLHGAAADLGIPVPGSNYANRRFCHDSTRGSDQ
ncbi:Cation transporter, partial [human gut metagenome]